MIPNLDEDELLRHIKSGLEEVKLLLEGNIDIVERGKQIEHEFHQIAYHLGIKLKWKYHLIVGLSLYLRGNLY